MSDKDITLAVERQLRANEAVASQLIDIVSDGGVVTLSGVTDHILAKERATEIALSVIGVHSVLNLIEVRPSKQSDNQIRKNVKGALRRDPVSEAYEINVIVEDGVVMLTGKVESWQEGQLAADVVKRVLGVRAVKNELIILYKTERPDAEIRAEVEGHLAADVRVDDALVKVEVSEGRVTLTGAVGSGWERWRAETDAWVSGVKAVDVSGLRVKWSERAKMRRKELYVLRDDAEIENDIKKVFSFDPRLEPFGIDVHVDKGFVTLTGVVDNLKASKVAEKDARNTIGVWHVRNYIKVRPATTVPDERLAIQIRKTLGKDPYLELQDIEVSVRNGMISLEGTVNNSFEREHAGDVVSRIEGVVIVENRLGYEHSWLWRPDWVIKADVERELFLDSMIDHKEIHVTVDDGVVILTGTVNSWHEYHLATQNAFEGGAKDVRNRLEIRYAPSFRQASSGASVYPRGLRG
ncbi:MAG: BON domain-containing protein [Acidiferrobacterales bacterium]